MHIEYLSNFEEYRGMSSLFSWLMVLSLHLIAKVCPNVPGVYTATGKLQDLRQ